MKKIKLLSFVALLIFIAYSGVSSAGTRDFDVVILNGRVMDPATGLDAARNIGIRDGQVAAITSNRLNGVRTIDASGLVVAPGFIDLHAHSQTDEAFRLMVQDGVTTAFDLERGTADVASWYGEREHAQIINCGVSVGHIPVRMEVFGDRGSFMPVDTAIDSTATPGQILQMRNMIELGLEHGAVAVGFGLPYTPGAGHLEISEMLRIVAQHGAIAFVHVKSGTDGLKEAMEFAAEMNASIHVAHANSSGGAEIAEFLDIIEAARRDGQDVSTEAYPYDAGMTAIDSALFDDWQTWVDSDFEKFEWPESGERLTRKTFAKYRAAGGNVIIHSRTPEMTKVAISSGIPFVASDGLLEDGKGHPRTSGTYARVLGQYVRIRNLMPLMEALRKMTIAPARRLESYVPQMRKKGRIAIGADADLTIFDAHTVIDQATYSNPTKPSFGIHHVLIGGVPVVENSQLQDGVRAGRTVKSR